MKIAAAWSLSAAATLLLSGAAAAQDVRLQQDRPRLQQQAAPKAQPVPALQQSMQVAIMRSAETGCEPGCIEWISAQGQIDGSTPRRFKAVLAQLGKRQLPVMLASPGGTVDDALTIGRLIRAKGLDVFVARTAVQPCAPTDTACSKLQRKGQVRGLPLPEPARCASSCAFILAAGARRFVGPTAAVGLHQVASFRVHTQVLRKYAIKTRYQWGVPQVVEKRLISEQKVGETKQQTITTAATYDRIRAYFVEMGVSETLMPILLSAPHTSIRWLNRLELTSTQIATGSLSAEQVLLTAPAAVPVAPASAFIVPPAFSIPVCNLAQGIVTGCTPAAPAAPTASPPQ